ncbi:MAG: hypothetical protein EA398_08085 [Deltaproteobacteria bacterium]|nr:MAG: hypothetical protein EA398_08085 [Deltaproteobacteria bacterium]
MSVLRWTGVLVALLFFWPLAGAASMAGELQGPGEELRRHIGEVLESSPRSSSGQYARGLQEAWDGRMGHSILALERARLVAPQDRAVDRALEVVRTETRRRHLGDEGMIRLTGGEPRGFFLLRLTHSLPVSTAAWWMVALAWVGGALGVRALRSRAEGGLDLGGVGALVCLVLALTLAGLLAAAPRVLEAVDPAVVVAAGVQGREAPDLLAAQRVLPALHEGALVRRLEERSGWAHVELADGERVWVRADAVEGFLGSKVSRGE